MRVVICSKYPTLVRALARRLEEAGLDDVRSLVGATQAAHAWLRRNRPDVVITDEWTAGTDLVLADLNFALLLLADHRGQSIVRAARRAVAVAERSTTLPEIVTLIAAMRATDTSESPPIPMHRNPPSWSTGIGRLAKFLSAREREVLSELVRGADTATVARRLQISRSTARDHIQSVLTKMDAHSRIQLVSMAVREGLIDPTSGFWLVDAG